MLTTDLKPLANVHMRDAEAIIAAVRSQIGKPYDWTGFGGFVFRSRNWQEDDSWFCSELVAWAFEQGGSPLFTPGISWRITPQHLYQLYHTSIYYYYND